MHGDRKPRRAYRCGAPSVAKAIAGLSERVSDISSDVHRLSHDLHPPKLELLGLSQAVAGLCRDVSSRFSVRIDFRQGVGSLRVSADAALCLFRVTQEALQNIVKHSGARAATVRLTRARQNIRLHVADDGKGVAGSSNNVVADVHAFANWAKQSDDITVLAARYAPTTG